MRALDADVHGLDMLRTCARSNKAISKSSFTVDISGHATRWLKPVRGSPGETQPEEPFLLTWRIRTMTQSQKVQANPPTICADRRSRSTSVAARMKPAHAVGACIALLWASVVGGAQPASDSTPRFEQLESMEARVQGCVTCHGQRGQGTNNGYFPRIAGKPAGYLYNQLLAFKNGTRKYPPMNYLVAYLPEKYLKEIAQHFAEEQPPFADREIAPATATVVARGEALVTHGDADKGVPACVACHGDRLTGMEPGIPGLVGLRPTYIVAQLTRWQVGDRYALEPDCMKRIAVRLSGEDISAVAAWLSRLEAPRNAKPETSNVIRMPLACGSQPRT